MTLFDNSCDFRLFTTFVPHRRKGSRHVLRLELLLHITTNTLNEKSNIRVRVKPLHEAHLQRQVSQTLLAIVGKDEKERVHLQKHHRNLWFTVTGGKRLIEVIGHAIDFVRHVHDDHETSFM